ncbi:hypothetical protein ACHHYP_11023 [Achlya hypogyna]|uniref:HTH CENPB-type domain-containing protein n=1 Tax=Achlya hypogyna TaxID=1202772 RepID=A0A1V9YK26_ACHHY|nr:hypothetical protein ACHHYP_11023 [Achlya hypogyna]
MAEKYDAAIKSVRTDKLSLRAACELHGIKSPTSLSLRIRGVLPVDCGRGRPPKYVTKSMETGVMETILVRARQGNCVSVPELRFIMHDMSAAAGKEPPETFPNPKWIERFLERHKDVSLRKGQILEVKRQTSPTLQNVEYYHANLAEIICKFTSDTVWNCDETGVCAQGRRAPRLICPIGLRANSVRSQDRENVSIMGCVNAAGQSLAPMYIYKGKMRKADSDPLDLSCYGVSRPSADYYNSNLMLHNFVTTDISRNINKIVYYEERGQGKDADAVCSLRMRYHLALAYEYDVMPSVLFQIMDNCVGQNKSKTVFQFFVLLSVLFYDKVAHFLVHD